MAPINPTEALPKTAVWSQTYSATLLASYNTLIGQGVH